MTYPEIDIEIAAPTEFPISSLERHRHLIILVQFFVKTFSRVRPEEDIMRRRAAD